MQYKEIAGQKLESLKIKQSANLINSDTIIKTAKVKAEAIQREVKLCLYTLIKGSTSGPSVFASSTRRN